MRSKIGRVNDPYDSFRALELAIKIMIENCKIFNGPGSTYVPPACFIESHVDNISIGT